MTDVQEAKWQKLLRYGRERGAAQGLPPDADEDTINEMVNAKIEEARQEAAERERQEQGRHGK